MARNKTQVHFAVILLLCMVTLALAAPAESQCFGKLDGGQVRFDLPSRITNVMSDPSCVAVWSIDDVVVASTEGFIPPVTSATPGTVFMNICPAALIFQLSCPNSDVQAQQQEQSHSQLERQCSQLTEVNNSAHGTERSSASQEAACVGSREPFETQPAFRGSCAVIGQQGDRIHKQFVDWWRSVEAETDRPQALTSTQWPSGGWLRSASCGCSLFERNAEPQRGQRKEQRWTSSSIG
ncbi:hypothetical protein SRHO_G00061240 [Serrasalmus rhombeus]